MKICHVSMFGPGRCGLYEASRDMCRADIESGHQVYFVDAGVTIGGNRENIQVGAVDERAGFKIVTAHPDLIQEADIVIMHTGIDDSYLVKSQAPVIWVVHGKPLDCFRPEQNGIRDSYSLYEKLSKWKRSKLMLYFWPEYKPYWEPAFPKDKHCILEYPVIDRKRFSNEGQKYNIENKGKYNVLICDSVRADIDMFEMAIGCIKAAEKIEGIKFHFIGFDHPIKKCWQIVLDRLKEVGGLGDVKERVTNMEQVYRAMDLTFSPNRIINRIVAESLCCGTPVLQELGGKAADYTCYIPNPNDVVEALTLFKKDFDAGKHKDGVIERSEVFDTKHYSKAMNEVYKKVVR